MSRCGVRNAENAVVTLVTTTEQAKYPWDTTPLTLKPYVMYMGQYLQWVAATKPFLHTMIPRHTQIK